MTKEKDIVSDILGRAEQAVREFVSRPEFMALLSELSQSGGGMEQRIADSLAQQIRAQDKPVRRHWGRSEAYVPARSPALEEAKRRALEEANLSGRPAEAASNNGISRATMYRLLSRNSHTPLK